MVKRIYVYFIYAVKQLYGFCIFGRRVDVAGFFRVYNPSNVYFGRKFCLNKNVFINARSPIHIGDDVILSYGVTLLAAGLDVHEFIENRACVYVSDASIDIGSHVWIGANATVLPGTCIGSNVVVAAGSVVRGKLQSNSLYAGNPVRLVRKYSH